MCQDCHLCNSVASFCGTVEVTPKQPNEPGIDLGIVFASTVSSLYSLQRYALLYSAGSTQHEAAPENYSIDLDDGHHHSLSG